MKIRQGFVSNSSSSSFVVYYDKNKHDIDTFKKVFDNIPLIDYGIYDSYSAYNSHYNSDSECDENHEDLKNCFVMDFEVPYDIGDDFEKKLKNLKKENKIVDFEEIC